MIFLELSATYIGAMQAIARVVDFSYSYVIALGSSRNVQLNVFVFFSASRHRISWPRQGVRRSWRGDAGALIRR